jgi:hypothetical protein
MNVLLSTSYFPSIEWLAWMVQSERAFLDKKEYFQKQSYRSRALIAGPMGLQTLSVPVSKAYKEIARAEVSYSENWVKDHLKAIESAYSNAPFFDVLFPDVQGIFNLSTSDLWELNLRSIALFLNWLDLPLSKIDCNSAPHGMDIQDQRGIHPKITSTVVFPEYGQVFKVKNGFINNLSGLDLFFNLGRSSWDYLNELVLNRTTDQP